MARNTEERTFLSLEQETRAAVDTDTAAFHLNRKPQTLRVWACRQTSRSSRPTSTGGWRGQPPSCGVWWGSHEARKTQRPAGTGRKRRKQTTRAREDTTAATRRRVAPPRAAPRPAAGSDHPPA
jgi:hypothetical protein